MRENTMFTTRKTTKHDPAGVIYSLNYELHIQQLIASLAQLAGPDIKASLRKVDIRVESGKATRIQALSHEITRLEVSRGSAEIVVGADA